jgi:hypothetical protein
MLDEFVAVCHANFHERLREPRNKISFEGRCTIRAEPIVLSLGIVSVYLPAPGIDMHVTRPVSSRDFDEHQRLKLFAISNFVAVLKVKSEVSDVRVCGESNLEESVSKISLPNSWEEGGYIDLDRALVGAFVRDIAA